MGIGCVFLFKTAIYSFSVCLKPSVEDFSEINSSVSESVILERSKSSKQQAYY
jgi:TFIIF-interacting CTD phosphatase-like protein